MSNIVWEQEDGTFAVTWMSDTIDSRVISAHLQAIGAVGSSTPHGFDMSEKDINELIYAKTPDQVRASVDKAIKALLNSTAQQYGYDDIISAVSYASSSNTKFKADGKAFSAWRDAVWSDWFTKSESVTGTDSVTAVVDALPAITTFIKS